MRKLALCRTFLFDFLSRSYKEYEPRWVEVYFFKNQWEFWSGKAGTVSTNKPDIIKFGEIK